MTGGAQSGRSIAVARPPDHAARIESSLALLSESRRLCRSTAAIIRETRLSIGRTLEMLAPTHGTLRIIDKKARSSIFDNPSPQTGSTMRSIRK
jgi:hypothetical protein